ncbi:vitellogenin II precursor [Nonlabens ulvanivorans]|uniref:Vitellogenin II n=1 Tax=Nonlabens ulvanivorans TaxID=906888 RepID=A0A090QCP5_NONUL|nr:vitellogenin II precursor [Nonlabens ulvanivorans]
MITITSCGSFDAVSYNDGIYGDSYEDEEIDQVSYEENSGSYYKNLFAEKAEQYGQNFGQDSVFTDVDSYSSQSYDQSNPDYTSNYGGGESGFGETPSTVVINYYDNGWNNWGWNRGFGWGKLMVWWIRLEQLGLESRIWMGGKPMARWIWLEQLGGLESRLWDGGVADSVGIIGGVTTTALLGG